MLDRCLLRLLACSAALFAAVTGARAFDDALYPDLKGGWNRLGGAQWDQTKRPGLPQQAPLTPEYQAVFEANLAETAAGGQSYNPQTWCYPGGMPRLLIAYGMLEFLVTPVSHDHAQRSPGRDARTSSPTGATGRRRSRRPSRAIRSANGSTRTATASTTCWRSRCAASKARACSTPAASPCTRTTRPSSRSEFSSTRPTAISCATRSRHRSRLHAALDGHEKPYARHDPLWIEQSCADGNRYVIVGKETYVHDLRPHADADPQGPAAARPEVFRSTAKLRAASRTT